MARRFEQVDYPSSGVTIRSIFFSSKFRFVLFFFIILKVLCPICRPEKEKVKYQRHLKDNTNSELPSKQVGLKMAFSEKITTISCRIDLSDCNHLSNSLIFRPFYRMVVRFVLHKDSISLILAITSSGLLM